jgi:DNA (cytosine-5)-methyltransferase 1
MNEGIGMTANKQQPSYSVVSYFCGCGGLDLGFRGDFRCHDDDYERLPFNIEAAYDKEPRCVETYNGYFGAHAKCDDLSAIDAKRVPKATVLIGGFPCQEFSSCGPLGGLDSERGKLYKALISYMEEHKPSLVIGENVINLERMDNGNVLKTIKGDLEKVGYKVQMWKMFAPDYGIPQMRTRLFFICVREDIHEKFGFPDEPVAKFKPDTYRSIEWAIGDLEKITESDSNGGVANQDQYFGASKAKKGNGQGDENNKKDKPAYTIRANPKSRVQFHYSLPRRLTVRECARIQTFPDNFKFTHAKTASVSQIGNAVPPVLAHIVATSIAEYLKNVERGNEDV